MRGGAFDVGLTLPTLSAERVRLRWLTATDIPSLFAIFGDTAVTRYWGFATLPDLAGAEALLADIHQQFHHRTLFQWGVETIGSGEVVGTCTLAGLDAANRRADLGFALGRAFWGRGYMAEILPPLLRFAFADLALHRITADVDPQNERSIRILERLGFQREGYLREHWLVQGEPQDAVLYGLLRSDAKWPCPASSEGLHSS
jgi:RimJ/RimL family protein N-acetyltransferase